MTDRIKPTASSRFRNSWMFGFGMIFAAFDALLDIAWWVVLVAAISLMIMGFVEFVVEVVREGVATDQRPEP